MKIGINLLLWTKRPTVAEHAPLLEKIKAWGYDGVEFPINEMDARNARSLAEICNSLGLGRTAILSLNPETADPASAEKRLRDAAVIEMQKAIDRTSEIGAEILGGPLFQAAGRFSGSPPTSAELQWVVETIRTAGEYARKAGIKLALEPINRYRTYIANTMKDGSALIERIGLDNVGLLADTHHGLLEESDTARAWMQSARHIMHVHISENNWGVPGSGQAISAGIFQALKSMKYGGWLTVEAFGRNQPDLIARLHLWSHNPLAEDDLAKAAYAYVKKNLLLVEDGHAHFFDPYSE